MIKLVIVLASLTSVASIGMATIQDEVTGKLESKSKKIQVNKEQAALNTP